MNKVGQNNVNNNIFTLNDLKKNHEKLYFNYVNQNHENNINFKDFGKDREIYYYLKTEYPAFKQKLKRVLKLINEKKINNSNKFSNLIVALLLENTYKKRAMSLFVFLYNNPSINFNTFLEFINENQNNFEEELSNVLSELDSEGSLESGGSGRKKRVRTGDKTFRKLAMLIKKKIEEEVNSNNKNYEQTAKLKIYEKKLLNLFTPSILKQIFKEQKNNPEKRTKMMLFIINLIEKESPYSPIGRISNNRGREIGRVYNALNVQWLKRNNNKFTNIMPEQPQNGRVWVSNKEKFKYLLKHFDKVEEIIDDSNNNIVINSLKVLFKGDYDSLKEFLENLLVQKSYVTRAFTLYEFLDDMGYKVDGKSSNKNIQPDIHFRTYKGDDGTFLTPLFQLYYLIKNAEMKEKKAILKAKIAKAKAAGGGSGGIKFQRNKKADLKNYVKKPKPKAAGGSGSKSPKKNNNNG